MSSCLTCHHSASVKARVVNWKQVDVAASRSRSSGCPVMRANCSLHVMLGDALSETVMTVLLSTVPRLSRQSCRLRVGKRTRGGGQAVSPTLTCCAFMWDLMTGHLDDYRCSAEVRGNLQETAPRKTAKNTVKHHDCGVGSVLANHRGGSESSVVITTLVNPSIPTFANTYSNSSPTNPNPTNYLPTSLHFQQRTCISACIFVFEFCFRKFLH